MGRNGSRQVAGASGRSTLLRAFTMVIVAAALFGMCAAAFADVTIFSDNFETAFAGWTQTHTPIWYTGTPKNGTHSIALSGSEVIERTIPTTGYSTITVSFALASNMGKRKDFIEASWYNGSAWTTLKRITYGDSENDVVLRTYSYSLPVGADNNASFRLRFEVVGNPTWSHAYVDDVLVSGTSLQYTLSLSGSGSGSVLVNGTLRPLPWSGQLVYGSEVRLEAAAADGWRFDGWSGDTTWSGSQFIVTMTADKSYTAHFSNASRTLSVAGSGSGSVRVNGVVHSLPWSDQFIRGREVTLEAVPADGWRFGGWSGDATWSGAELIVSMTDDKNLTATFTDASYTLTLSKVGSGSVRVNGVLSELPWSGRVLMGSQVTLEAVPASGWQFDSWSGDASWSGETLVLTMSSNKSITANFAERTSFVLSLSKDGAGTVKVNGAAVSLPWSGEFDRGAQVTIEAVADAAWRFDGWSGDLSGSDSPAALAMDRDWTISAAFSQIHYRLSVDGLGSGSVKVDGVVQTLPWSDSFVSGAHVTLEGVAERGWRFAGWSGGLTSTENPVTVELNDDMPVSATFIQPDEFMLTLTKVGRGRVKVNGSEQSLPWTGTFPRGSEVTLEAVAEGAEQFVEWSGDATGSDNPVTVTMDYDEAVTATFMCVQPPFSDVSCDYWAADAISAARDAGVVDGYADGRYRPGLAVDRGAMAVFIARAVAGGQDQIPQPTVAEPTFLDVPADHWAYAAVEYAVSKGIVQGYGGDSFLPGLEVTRGQMAVFVARAIAQPMGEQGLEAYEPPAKLSFPDVPTSMWCYKHVEYLASQSIAAGYPDGKYRPLATVTRDQMAVYVARAFELID